MKYYSGSMAELEAQVAHQLSKKRFEHCLRVRDYAQKLASQNQIDSEQAAVAGLVHDYAKERSDAEFLAVIGAKHLDSDLVNWGNPVWHGIVGAEIIKDELGITDPLILQAVRDHTTGAGANMSRLSQVIFMADYLESGRDFPGVQTARTITDEDLGQGVRFQIIHTLAYLAKNERLIYPKSLTTYNYWVTQ